MSNGKRPECWRCPECGAMWLENADEEIGVTLAMECGPCGSEMERAGPVLPVSDLESIAQELERHECRVNSYPESKAYGKAAQLVRAKIEEGEARG